MRHIFERVKILVFGRDFDGTAPASGAVEKVAIRVGDVGAVDVDSVVMKSFIQWPGVAEPCAVIALGELTAAPEADANRLSLGRDDAEFNSAFGVDLRIFFPALVRSGGFPIIGGFVGLRVGGLGCE